MKRFSECTYLVTLAALCILFAVAAIWVGWGWIFATLFCVMLLADKAL
jgi:hypothetical protein